MKPQSEAEKFFASLPSEAEEKKDFQFFEPTKQEELKVEEPVEEPKPEKVEDSEEEQTRRPNRQERRREQNKFWEEQLARERERAERLETELLKRTQPQTQEEVDSRLTRLFGDTPQGKEASRIVLELLKETEERATTPYRQLEQSREEEQQAEAHFDEVIADGLEAVEDTYGVDLSSRSAQKVRSDFLDFVEELSPEDSLVNFEKAWSLFQATQKAPRDAETIVQKKAIASRSIQRSSAARPDVKTEPITFDKVNNIFDRMFNKH